MDMNHAWQLQEAKNKFSEVIEAAITQGPQIITKRGVETAILMAIDDYRKLLLRQQGLVEFFQKSPLVDADLDLSRDHALSRDSVYL